MLDQELRFRMATRAVGAAVWDWDMVTDKITCDAAMYAMYDVDPGEKPMTPSASTATRCACVRFWRT